MRTLAPVLDLEARTVPASRPDPVFGNASRVAATTGWTASKPA